MQEIELRIPSRARSGAAGGQNPVGRTRHAKRAEQGHAQGPASPCAPESARPDRSQPPKPKAAPKETLTQKGAIALARRLQEYWHVQGHHAARFWEEPIEERFEKVGSYEIYRVASNLVNGLPPRYVNVPDV